MGRPVASVADISELPEEIRSASTLSEPDYGDMFRMDTSADSTAEAWARAIYEDSLGARGRFVFGGILGLDLAPSETPRTVAGWRIAGQGVDWIRLEAEGDRLIGQIVVRAADGQVSVATFLRYVSRLGSLVWTLWSTLHRKAMPGMLRDAAEIIEG